MKEKFALTPANRKFVLLIAINVLLLVLVGLLLSANQRNHKIVERFEWKITQSFHTMLTNHAEMDGILYSLNFTKPDREELEHLSACCKKILNEITALDQDYQRIYGGEQDEYKNVRQGMIQFYTGISNYMLRRKNFYQQYEEDSANTAVNAARLELIAGLNLPIWEVLDTFREDFHLKDLNSLCQALNDRIHTYSLEVYNKDLEPAVDLQDNESTIFDWFEEMKEVRKSLSEIIAIINEADGYVPDSITREDIGLLIHSDGPEVDAVLRLIESRFVPVELPIIPEEMESAPERTGPRGSYEYDGETGEITYIDGSEFTHPAD